MLACGIDVSVRRAQQVCLLGDTGATFYEPGDVSAVVAAVRAFGPAVCVAVDAPSAPRQDLLAPGAPLRDELGLKAGTYERWRVCDALLRRAGLPLYPVPATVEDAPEWMQVGFTLVAALEREAGLELVRPDRVLVTGERAPATGRLVETYPDAVFCGLLDGRPAPKDTPAGIHARVAALERAGVDDAHLRERTLDELDACAAALVARAVLRGDAAYAGHRDEGVIALPAPLRTDGYPALAPTAPREHLPAPRGAWRSMPAERERDVKRVRVTERSRRA